MKFCSNARSVLFTAPTSISSALLFPEHYLKPIEIPRQRKPGAPQHTLRCLAKPCKAALDTANPFFCCYNGFGV